MGEADCNLASNLHGHYRHRCCALVVVSEVRSASSFGFLTLDQVLGRRSHRPIMSKRALSGTNAGCPSAIVRGVADMSKIVAAAIRNPCSMLAPSTEVGSVGSVWAGALSMLILEKRRPAILPLLEQSPS